MSLKVSPFVEQKQKNGPVTVSVATRHGVRTSLPYKSVSAIMSTVYDGSEHFAFVGCHGRGTMHDIVVDNRWYRTINTSADVHWDEEGQLVSTVPMLLSSTSMNVSCTYKLDDIKKWQKCPKPVEKPSWNGRHNKPQGNHPWRRHSKSI